MEENENIREALKEAYELGEEMAESYDKGYMNSLYKTNASVVKAFKTRYEAIGYQLKYGLITEEEYYNKLEEIRDRYFSKNSQEWHKYTAEIYEYKVGVLQSYKEAVEDNLNDILKISQDKFSKLKKEQEGYSEELKDFAGGIGLKSHEVYIGNYHPNGDPLIFTEHSLVDFDKEIEKLERFLESIEKLKVRAGDISPETLESFFSELGNIPIEDAQALMDLLIKSNEADFNDYFASYQKKNDLADIVSASLYEVEAENIATELRKELETAFGEIPEEFFVYGEQTGESFVDGFMSKVEGFIGELESFLTQAQIDISKTEETSGNQSVFSPSYNFYGDNLLTSRIRLTAKNDALLAYMRGME